MSSFEIYTGSKKEGAGNVEDAPPQRNFGILSLVSQLGEGIQRVFAVSSAEKVEVSERLYMAIKSVLDLKYQADLEGMMRQTSSRADYVIGVTNLKNAARNISYDSYLQALYDLRKKTSFHDLCNDFGYDPTKISFVDLLCISKKIYFVSDQV